MAKNVPWKDPLILMDEILLSKFKNGDGIQKPRLEIGNKWYNDGISCCDKEGLYITPIEHTAKILDEAVRIYQHIGSERFEELIELREATIQSTKKPIKDILEKEYAEILRLLVPA